MNQLHLKNQVLPQIYRELLQDYLKDVTSNYILDDGQRDEYADYSRIVRKDGATIPSRRVRVIFDKFTVPANDTGDVFAVGSYPANNLKDVPLLKNGLRASDTLDFRPRVADYSGSGSPFAFESRVFDSSGTNPTLVPAPNEAHNTQILHTHIFTQN